MSPFSGRAPCHVAGHQRVRRRPLVRGRGARPRPHSQRVNASAIALGLKPTMSVDEIVGLTWDGLKKFDGKTAVYIRPMYWAEHGGYMGVPAEPSSTRFCLCLYESPMISPTGFLDHRVAVPAADRSKPCRPTPRPAAFIPTTAGPSSKPRCAASTMRWCSTCWAMSRRRGPPTFSWSRTAMW